MWIQKTFSPFIDSGIIFDPCVGAGNLLWPWFEAGYECWAGDIRNHKLTWLNVFLGGPFEELPCWMGPSPELVVCNPPFTRAIRFMGRRRMWPEVFLRTMRRIFHPTVPIIMMVPIGFRANQTMVSERYRWTREECDITSIISLPLNVFPGVKFFTEILIFGIPEAKPHYWLDEETVQCIKSYNASITTAGGQKNHHCIDNGRRGSLSLSPKTKIPVSRKC